MHLTRQALCRRATDRLVLTQTGAWDMRRGGEAMSFYRISIIEFVLDSIMEKIKTVLKALFLICRFICTIDAYK